MVVKGRTRSIIRNAILIGITVVSIVAGLDSYHLVRNLANLNRSTPVSVSVTSKPIPAKTPRTAGYNDGWTDGQTDLVDLLGIPRVPNDTEYAAFVRYHKADSTCHLKWDGAVRPVYVVVCIRNGKTVPIK